MNGAYLGIIGGIIGGALGIAGGIIGTYFSIKNTKSPRERSFIIKLTTFFWGIALIAIGLIIFLPMPYKLIVPSILGILMPLFIIFGNRKLQMIRNTAK